MAEPLSIVAFGLELSKALIKFADTVRGAGTTLKHIAKEVDLTSGVLKPLDSTLEKCKKHGLGSDNAIKAVKDLLQACSEDFKQINATFKKAKAASKRSWWRRSIFKLTRWPYLRKKMEHQRSNLEKHKNDLILGLSSLGLDIKAARSLGIQECDQAWEQL
ncbi:hypothetical protein MMC29_001804, partial [Sticta canariensis]|nr:hypothetical protein [Sticta canariensis]